MTKFSKAGLGALLDALHPTDCAADAAAAVAAASGALGALAHTALSDCSNRSIGSSREQTPFYTNRGYSNGRDQEAAGNPYPSTDKVISSSGAATDCQLEQQQHVKEGAAEAKVGWCPLSRLVLVKCKGLGGGTVAQVLADVAKPPMEIQVTTQLPEDELRALSIT
jgi:hypothetical protein